MSIDRRTGEGGILDDRQSDIRQRCIGVGIALGVAIGAGLGVAFGNLALGIGPGIAIGVALGVALGNKRAEEGQRPSQADGDNDS